MSFEQQNCEAHARASLSLSDFSLVDEKPSTIQMQMAVRRPNQDEVFTPTGEVVTLACLIVRDHDTAGRYLGEKFYPVARDLHAQLGTELRQVKFYGCISSTGVTFIVPCKQARNTWNDSLDGALRTAPGTFIRLKSNKASQRYEVSQENVANPPDVAFSEFESTLKDGLADGLVTTMYHPAIPATLRRVDADF